MDKPKKNNKKQGKTKKKNELPVLTSDTDFLEAFLTEESGSGAEKKNGGDGSQLNKHGLPFIDDYAEQFMPGETHDGQPEVDATDGQQIEELSDEEFSRLLDESFKSRKIPRHKPKPMPLKRRLKRYPAPELDLDLHGFTSLGAELKAKSFITTAKRQGFFTLRIIVGKGMHSEEGPVLPHVIVDLLKSFKKDNIVLSYEWERGKKNKSGVIIVYLKQFND